MVDYLHLIAGTISRNKSISWRVDIAEKANWLREEEKRDAVSNRDGKPIYPLEARVPWPPLIYRRTLSGFSEDRGAQTSSLDVSPPLTNPTGIVRRRRMGQWRGVPLDLARPESFAL